MKIKNWFKRKKTDRIDQTDQSAEIQRLIDLQLITGLNATLTTMEGKVQTETKQILPKDLLDDLEKGDRTMEMLKNPSPVTEPFYGQGIPDILERERGLQNAFLQQFNMVPAGSMIHIPRLI